MSTALTLKNKFEEALENVDTDNRSVYEVLLDIFLEQDIDAQCSKNNGVLKFSCGDSSIEVDSDSEFISGKGFLKDWYDSFTDDTNYDESFCCDYDNLDNCGEKDVIKMLSHNLVWIWEDDNADIDKNFVRLFTEVALYGNAEQVISTHTETCLGFVVVTSRNKFSVELSYDDHEDRIVCVNKDLFEVLSPKAKTLVTIS